MAENSCSRGKLASSGNLIAAFIFLLISVWTLVADLTFRANFLFQPSWSLPVLWLFITLWFLAGLILAIFPKRIFITAATLLTLRSSFGWPLMLGADIATACRVLDGLIALIAVIYLLWAIIGHRRLSARPVFQWQHSAIAGVTWILLSVTSLVTGFLGAAEALNSLSRGFVQLTPKGISFTERVLQKDGCQVHLVGLAHIGEQTFYNSLNHEFKKPIEGKRLVLTEGVTDKEEVLPPGFKSGKTYRGFAKQLGLAEQKSFSNVSTGSAKERNASKNREGMNVSFINADIDISDLSETHLGLLLKLLGSIDSGDLLKSFQTSFALDMSPDEMEDLIVEGLIGQRNTRLMQVFESHHRDYEEIYIPWGAAHLPDLERRFLSLGFSMIGEKKRIGIGFGR